ncbi:ShlB/FhaC/HecB family hemolysin secretion/activation protein [Allosphingosinicella flava]|uniref:ShlB/FhaC/HecB family hemolysin secretion/activation protein n=1 Tax=Allosphingosinicella flava TaxID=2771430 RepID=A0A7T2LLC4_9SPHN|nr:ShlB/FhaC/HecB family hemolysin secretion/activation protein [Sphingosinicella flava]QPQ54356.1 ShlB/FhaC/HecB family hemolysin secretion/activation protein [Sphingosinicella flava]
MDEFGGVAGRFCAGRDISKICQPVIGAPRRLAKAPLWAAAMLAMALPAAAAAQNALPSREELSPAERTAISPGRQASGIEGQLSAGPCPFAASDLRFTLQGIDFGGLTALPQERLASSWSDLKGREVPVSEICRIRDKAADLLLAEGFLARVEIPPQEIRDGRVRLEVIEARIAAVRVHGSAGAAQRQVERYMASLQGLAPFDLNVVQRQILLASDIPGIRLSTNVRPAEGEAGAVELDVQVERDAISALAGAQNFSSDAAGPWTLLGRVDFNSFTSLGERTSLVVSSTSDFDEQRVIQLLEEIRLGGSGLLARGSISYARSRPSGAISVLDLEGESLVGTAELAYPAIRHRRHNLWVAAGIEAVDQTSDAFDGLARLIDDKLRILYLRLDGNQRTNILSMPAFASLGLELRKGLSALGASKGGEADLSRAKADPQATLLRVNGRAEMALAPGVSLATSLLFQWADDPLLAYEELAIGNYTIGRGYDPGAVAGDRVAASALELRYGPFGLGPVSGSAFGFIDSAWVENLDPGFGSGERKVQSGGGGVRFGLTDRLSLDLTYAHPFDRPVAGGPKASDRLLVNLITRF